MVRLLISDCSDPRADFAAMNESPVFRVLTMPLERNEIRRHFHDALDWCGGQRPTAQRLAASGSGLRDALAILAHEINTPLSLIQGYSDALIQRSGMLTGMAAPTGAEQKALEAIGRNAKHCLRLMTQTAQAALGAFPHRQPLSCAASGLVAVLMDAYPFTAKERARVSIRLVRDFHVPSGGELALLVMYLATRVALDAPRGMAQARLCISVDVRDGARLLQFEASAEPSAETLETPGSRSIFDNMSAIEHLCQRMMHTQGGDFRLDPSTGGGPLMVLRLGPLANDAQEKRTQPFD